MEGMKCSFEIINAVREQPCLYDKRHKQYPNKYVRQETFDEIANKLEIPSELLIKRWNLLRQKFSKEMRKVKIREKPSEWPLYKNMDFLEQYILPRSRNNNSNQLLSPNFKEEDSIHFLDCDVDDESQINVEDVMNYVNHNELKVAAGASPTSELTTSSSHVDSEPAVKRTKISIDALYKKLEQTISNIEKTVNCMPATMNTDEVFAKSIVCLMQDLPFKVKEKFQADTLQKLYQLRAEVREQEFI